MALTVCKVGLGQLTNYIAYLKSQIKSVEMTKNLGLQPGAYTCATEDIEVYFEIVSDTLV